MNKIRYHMESLVTFADMVLDKPDDGSKTVSFESRLVNQLAGTIHALNSELSQQMVEDGEAEA